MKHAVNASAEHGGGGPRSSRPGKVNSRSDLFPRLVAMQKLANADNFAVFRTAGSGALAKQRLVSEIDNWSSVDPKLTHTFVELCADLLLQHLDRSVLPLVWLSEPERSAGLIALKPFIALVEEIELPGMGIVFPVRLGAIGNGFVVFSGEMISLKGDSLVELHTRSCQVMRDLLSLDERRATATEALSEREIACLQLAGDGRISEEIAEKLGLSVHTVNAYLGSATVKLNSVNRIQAIAKAIRLGYID
ncbi:transcriptional regulator VisR [Oryzifoliimicrobium ureilyticus]|uniref:transcriptional regulator VisR n=1 Tax=Oryzifoliimicrobium ureilyticus TaxID=3113724 RepID=UPI003F67FCCF